MAVRVTADISSPPTPPPPMATAAAAPGPSLAGWLVHTQTSLLVCLAPANSGKEFVRVMSVPTCNLCAVCEPGKLRNSMLQVAGQVARLALAGMLLPAS